MYAYLSILFVGPLPLPVDPRTQLNRSSLVLGRARSHSLVVTGTLCHPRPRIWSWGCFTLTLTSDGQQLRYSPTHGSPLKSHCPSPNSPLGTTQSRWDVIIIVLYLGCNKKWNQFRTLLGERMFCHNNNTDCVRCGGCFVHKLFT